MIYIGADHRGFRLKEEIKKWLESHHYDQTTRHPQQTHRQTTQRMSIIHTTYRDWETDRKSVV